MKSFYILILTSLLLTSCGKINLLTLDQEIQLGKQSRDQVFAQYGNKVLNPNSSDPKVKAAYQYVYNVRNAVLNSGNVEYKDRFAWEVYIINDPTLNAFCTPGGYIFFYTGLINYLEDGSSFAGVMGHEIAHADLRHSGKQITNKMGIDILLSIIAGASSNQVAELTSLFTNLGALQYSQSFEKESDAASVKYLCPTAYRTDGAHRFFEKLIADGNSSSGPTFLSTHPDPGDRVNNIKSDAAKISGNCTTNKLPYNNDPEYTQFKKNLGL
jgi:predicted Zn-dependent protease